MISSLNHTSPMLTDSFPCFHICHAYPPDVHTACRRNINHCARHIWHAACQNQSTFMKLAHDGGNTLKKKSALNSRNHGNLKTPSIMWSFVWGFTWRKDCWEQQDCIYSCKSLRRLSWTDSWFISKIGYCGEVQRNLTSSSSWWGGHKGGIGEAL